MKKIFLLFASILFLNNINSENIKDSNFLEFFSNKNFFSAQFLQTTLIDSQERKIKGEIKANRKGMFKIIYQEPLNEIILSNGKLLYRLDKEIEQLDISKIDVTLSESPIGIFSSNKEELEDIYEVTQCSDDREQIICVLNPKYEESFLKEVAIQLTNNELSSLTYVDTFEQIVVIDFTETSWDEIPNNIFSLEIPEGIDVVNH